jgi:hypothetical protein
VIHARYLCVKLRARFPQLRIVIGLWDATQGLPDAARRLRDSGADEVVTALADAVAELAKREPAPAPQLINSAISLDVEDRGTPRKLQPELTHRQDGGPSIQSAD